MSAQRDELHEGAHVTYHPVAGNAQTTTGTIKKILTQPSRVGAAARMVKASPEGPRYVIENDHTHKQTAYKEAQIEQVLQQE